MTQYVKGAEKFQNKYIYIYTEGKNQYKVS